MSTATVSGAVAPDFTQINQAAQSTSSPTQTSSLRQLSGSLQGTILGFQDMIKKIQSVVQMIFTEILTRIASLLTCFTSFNTCIQKIEEAFCPNLVSAPDLKMTLKQALASIMVTSAPTASNPEIKVV